MQIRKFIKKSLALLFVLIFGSLIIFFSLYLYVSPQLPSIDGLSDVRLQVPLRIYSSDGALLGEFGEKRRTPKSIDEIPLLMQQAFLSAEDDRFYQHPGVDYQGILRAVLNLIKTGERGQGGSTITMQLARNFYLSREKTYSRKLNEIFLALKIESELPKDKILELYLNKIYLGKRSYGVAAAAKVYSSNNLKPCNFCPKCIQSTIDIFVTTVYLFNVIDGAGAFCRHGCNNQSNSCTNIGRNHFCST